MTDQVNAIPHYAIQEFLYRESALLDDGRYDEWFNLVDERIRYFMPIRVTRMRKEGTEFSAQGHIDDLYPALKSRVGRMASRYNWAENPLSRTRHHVSNIRIELLEEKKTPGEPAYGVLSNLLFVRSRVDDPAIDIISCERHDVLISKGASFRLLQRTVLLDHTTIDTHNLAFLL